MDGEKRNSTRQLWMGIGLTFVLPFAAGPFMWIFRDVPFAALLVGPASYIAALVITKRAGRQAMFKGLLIGLAIPVGLSILLVAACFGVLGAAALLSRR